MFILHWLWERSLSQTRLWRQFKTNNTNKRRKLQIKGKNNAAQTCRCGFLCVSVWGRQGQKQKEVEVSTVSFDHRLSVFPYHPGSGCRVGVRKQKAVCVCVSRVVFFFLFSSSFFLFPNLHIVSAFVFWKANKTETAISPPKSKLSVLICNVVAQWCRQCGGGRVLENIQG